MDNRILKYFLGELDTSERRILIEQIETDTLLKEEFIRMQNIHTFSQLSPQANDREESRKSFEKFSQRLKNNKRKNIFKQVFQYAAVAVILIASTALLTHYISVSHIQETTMNTLYVPSGQRARITLQDGTDVWLNAQSTLIYPSYFSGNERKIHIIGEAFFDVAENASKPFIVSTQGIEMKVLGTQFNVYSYSGGDYIQTDLIDGSLKVYKERNEKDAVILRPNEQVIIRDHKMTVRNIANTEHFLWKNGIYSFNQEKLTDIIRKLELYYDVKIIVKDPEIFDVPYTGKFRQRDGIDEILRIIRKIQPFNIKKDIENNIITLTK